MPWNEKVCMLFRCISISAWIQDNAIVIGWHDNGWNIWCLRRNLMERTALMNRHEPYAT